MFNKKTLSIVILGLIVSYSFASPSELSRKQLIQQEGQTSLLHINQQESTSSSIKKYQEEQAARWGITEKEWQKFEEIKKGPRGYWSPNLDPLTTLGIEAETEAERQHYAELQARMEFERAEKELSYQRAYTLAFKRLYPNRLPIENLGKPKLSVDTVNSKQRLTVFIKQDCVACDKQVKDLQKSNIAFDIYMVDSNNNDAAIRKWATKVGINPQLVLGKVITLNHGAKLWQKVGDQSASLPLVYREVNGQLVRSH